MNTLDSNLFILMYHQIAKPPKDAKIRGLFTTPAQFEWQLRQLIKNNFQLTSFEEIEKNGLSSTKKNLVLTFDDGADCFIKNAFPILKKLKLKAVLYPVVGALGKKNVVFDESTNKSAIDIVTEEQLKYLSEEGIEIGSHLMDHICLSKRSEEEMKTELEESKTKLEKILHKKVVSVAYPFGDYNDKVVELAQKAKYNWGVITEKGSNTGVDRLRLKRYSIKGNKLPHYFKFWNILKELKEAV